MDRDDFYLARAEECEERARGLRDPVQRDQWLKMAQDWRTMLRGEQPSSANDD